MIIKDIHSLGGTCDRCGKGLTNVAVIELEGVTHTVGLDCLNKTQTSDFAVQREVSQAIKDARILGSMKRLLKKAELKVKFEQAGGGDVAYYYSAKGWVWLGLHEQNVKGLRKEIWQLVTENI